MDATTVAIDLAKDVFEVAVANRTGRIVARKRLRRRPFERFLEELAPGTEVIMEACGTAHYWGRRCQARDLPVRLLPTQYVRPYVRRNKTDRTDTEALLEAARCGGVPPVGVKSAAQQTLRARQAIDNGGRSGGRGWRGDRGARASRALCACQLTALPAS